MWLSAGPLWPACATAAPPPEIAYTTPAAVAPGETIDLTIHGKNLQQARQLWTSFPARCECIPLSTEVTDRAVCRVTVPRDQQVGIAAIRFVTMSGVSNPLLIMLDDLPSLAEADTQNAAENAQQVSLPIAIDAVCDALKEDYFQFRARAGERISFEVMAQRIGSRLDPVLRLLKPDGSELAVADDSPGIGGDCRLSHRFEEDGNYIVSVGDVRHEGGANYRYRLRMGDFPLPLVAFPLGGMAGEIATFQILGLALDAMSPLHVQLPDAARPQMLALGVPGREADGSGLVTVRVGMEPNLIEVEPNNDLGQATPVTLPAAINGTIESPNDTDYFLLEAAEGDRLFAAVHAAELGSPCDVAVRVLDKNGGQVAQASPQRETVLDYTIGNAGPYYLHVEELLGEGGPEYAYRVEVADTKPPFRVSAEAERVTAPQGGTFVTKVKAARQGYKGPIELHVDGLGDDITVKNATFEGEETTLSVTLPESLQPGTLRLARVTAAAQVGDQPVTAGLDQYDVIKGLFPDTIAFPTVLEQTIAVAVGPRFPPFYEIALAEPKAYFAQRVGKGHFDINIKPLQGDYKGGASFSVEGLPEGITAEIQPVEKSTTQYRVTLTGPPEIALGQHPLRVSATAEFQNQTQQVTLEQVGTERGRATARGALGHRPDCDRDASQGNGSRSPLR